MLAPSGSAASPHRIKTAREIDRDLRIEQRIVAVGDLCKLHDAALLTSTSIPPNGRSAASNITRTAERALTSALVRICFCAAGRASSFGSRHGGIKCSPRSLVRDRHTRGKRQSPAPEFPGAVADPARLGMQQDFY